MTTSIIDDVTLKVHIATDGAVWYLDGDRMPAHSGMGPVEFLQTSLCRTSSCFRLVGSDANAGLLIRLFERKVRGEIRSLEVGSPLVGRGRGAAADPAVLLGQMRMLVLPPSLGGWHQFGMLDYASYAMAVAARVPAVARLTGRLLLRHPAWPYISFITHLDQDKLTQLLGVILDPRWYINPDDPDSLGFLKNYLGLRPDIVTAIGLGRPVADRGAGERARLVLDTWKPAGSGTAGTAPGDFLWRRWRRHTTEHEADLRTSHAFVAFLRACWLDAIYAYTHNDGMFVAAHYFKAEPEVAAAFTEHRDSELVRIRSLEAGV